MMNYYMKHLWLARLYIICFNAVMHYFYYSEA